MKKVLLLAITAGISLGASAQKARTVASTESKHVSTTPQFNRTNSAARTTATGDTLGITHITSADTITIYSVPNDSGFIAGTDAFGDMGFAERYNVVDTTFKVIGLDFFFGGDISATSTKTVTFNVWSTGPQTAVTGSSTIFYSGLPSSTSLASQSMNITDLGIGISVGDTAADTEKYMFFTTPTGYLSQPFFVGYTINYTWATLAGDTLGLYSNLDGERTSSFYTVAGGDTIINDVNATMYADGTWHDNALENFNIFYNYYIFPIVVEGKSLSVTGINRHGFTFYGNYPNPAVNSTNIKLSLATNADVTISIKDMVGHTINTIKETNLPAGDNIIPVNTSNMPAGDYIYTVRTSTGDGIGCKLTVIK